jgi:hypothetical protein
MALSIEQIVFDCEDAESLAGFWSKVLDRPVDEGGNSFFTTIGRGPAATNGQPALMFLKVPEPKQTKNRLHLDLVDHGDGVGWAAEVDRLTGLGAVQVAEHKEYGIHWVTLRDPEGNEFDLGTGMD